MTRKQAFSLAAAAIVAAAALTVMIDRHRGAGSAHERVQADMVAGAPQLTDAALLEAVRQSNAAVQNLQVRNVGGIVVLRGTADKDSSEKAAAAVRTLGATRVANLITAATPVNDEAIRREAERTLATTRALDGCTLKVSCERGVIRVTGKAQSELQADVARSVLHAVPGAQAVEVDLKL